MARLTRKNIKVFAGNATNNGVFGSLQAENPVTTTNVEQIQSLPAWSVGWDSATMTSEKLPPLEEFQGIQYVTTYQQAYLMQEGIPEWAATVTYYKGSVVKEVTASGFKIYNSLTDNNTNNILSDTSNWSKVMDSSDLYAFDSAVVHLAGAETITGAKTFSSAVTLANNTWNTIGNDVQIGDMNNAGKLSIRGLNGYTGIYFYPENENSATNGIYLQPDNYNGLCLTDTSSSRAWSSILCTVSYIKSNGAGNGYYKLGNGLIIQYGKYTYQDATDYALTFPTPFTSTDYQITFGHELNESTPCDFYGAQIRQGTKATTGCTIYNRNANTTRTSWVTWIAIGY